MKKKVLLILIVAVMGTIFLFGCSHEKPEKYTAVYYDLFDTVTQITAYASSHQAFERFSRGIYTNLSRFHQVFDGYHAYEGIDNLWHLNHADRMIPVHCEKELYDLLKWMQQMQPAAHQKVNIAMGNVLSVWHKARETLTVPDPQILKKAAEHSDLSTLVFDDVSQTVYFSDPNVTLDIGAVAKGYAVEKVSQIVPAENISSYILNAGGNVKCAGIPFNDEKEWRIGIANPDCPQKYSMLLHVHDTSVVTSGDYQRFFESDGIRYHHLIDPVTLRPSEYFRSVTVVIPDSETADFLSTALFLMPYEEGKALLERFENAECLWICENGEYLMTDGMKSLLY